MSGDNWKRHERVLAKRLGGKRAGPTSLTSIRGDAMILMPAKAETRGFCLFRSLHVAHPQLNTVVTRAPVISGLPRAVLAGSVGNRCGGGSGMLKFCGGCGQWRETTEFRKNRCKSDGLDTQCKKCRSAYAKEYVKRNAAKIKEYRHNYHVEHAERDKQQHAEYRKRYADSIKKDAARYRKENADVIRRWREEHADHLRHYLQEYRKAHIDQIKARLALNVDSARDHCARRRARCLGTQVETFTRAAIFRRDRGICHACHRKVDPRHWHLDHLVPLARGGEHTRQNVAVAHPECNLRRADHGPAQLRLWGDV